MKEGDVVIIVGKLDDRIRDGDSMDARIGTIVWIMQDEVVVLIKDNLLWKGPRRDVVLEQDHR